MQNNSPSKSSNSNDNFKEEFTDINKNDASSNFYCFKDDCLFSDELFPSDFVLYKRKRKNSDSKDLSKELNNNNSKASKKEPKVSKNKKKQIKQRKKYKQFNVTNECKIIFQFFMGIYFPFFLFLFNPLILQNYYIYLSFFIQIKF